MNPTSTGYTRAGGRTRTDGPYTGRAGGVVIVQRVHAERVPVFEVHAGHRRRRKNHSTPPSLGLRRRKTGGGFGRAVSRPGARRACRPAGVPGPPCHWLSSLT